MKNLFLFISFIISTICLSQTDTIYFNSSWIKSSRSEAEFFRIILPHGNDYLVKDMYLRNNRPQMIAICNVLEPLNKNGKCTYYSSDGVKDNEGNYLNNKKIGIWTQWFDNQRDSTVTYYNEDGTDTIIRAAKKDTGTIISKDMFTNVDVFPSYKGGEEAMIKFIRKNIKYPKVERNAGISGTCYVTFVIEKNGEVTNARILRGVPGGPGCDKEALRVINKMHKWKPGIQNAKNVRVQFNMPIKFTLQKKS